MGEEHIGRKVREIRSWRGLSLKELADLCGWTPSYLSRIEHGYRPVTKRATLDALAAALRVAPAELAEQTFPPSSTGPEVSESQASIVALEAALSDLRLGSGGKSDRSWSAVTVDLRHLNDVLRPKADYAAQGRVIPGLLHDLHQLYITDGENRTRILQAMMTCYQTAAVLLKNNGVRGLPALAAFHARNVAEELDDPAWFGLSSWIAASTTGGDGRTRMLEISQRGAAELEPHLDDSRSIQMYGQLHLSSALSSAALGQYDNAIDHLDEAGRIANRTGPPLNRGMGGLYFGPDNVGIWRISVAVEMGDGGRAKELAKTVDLKRIDSAARHAMFWADIGRGLAERKATRQEAVDALLRAEQIAPQRIRLHPLVRETVGDLMRRARREAVARDLRGLGYRMGLNG